MGLFDDTSGIDWGQIATGMPTYNPLPTPTPFQSRWPTPGSVPPAPTDPMQSPISPEALAASAASRGIPPPQQDLVPPAAQPIRMPGQEAMDNWRAGVDVTNAGMGGTGVTPTPGAAKPLDVTTPVQQAAAGNTDVSAQSKTPSKDKTASLADVLKGTKMPEGPTLQKLGTPAAPKPTNQIKSGDLIAMLQALNTGGNMQSGYQLPSTLGQALLGRK